MAYRPWLIVMQMTSSMLSLCLALALASVVLLLWALHGLLRSVRRQPNGYLWAAGLIATVGLLAVDTVVLWCLIEYGLFGSQALQWPVYVWIVVGLAVLLFVAAMRWARRTSNIRPATTTHRSGSAP